MGQPPNFSYSKWIFLSYLTSGLQFSFRKNHQRGGVARTPKPFIASSHQQTHLLKTKSPLWNPPLQHLPTPQKNPGKLLPKLWIPFLNSPPFGRNSQKVTMKFAWKKISNPHFFTSRGSLLHSPEIAGRDDVFFFMWS